MISLLAQVVPPTPPAAGWTFWQFVAVITPALLVFLAQVANWLKANQNGTKIDAAGDSARSAESHARIVAHHCRHLDTINTKLEHIAKALPLLPVEEELRHDMRQTQAGVPARPPRPEGGQ